MMNNPNNPDNYLQGRISIHRRDELTRKTKPERKSPFKDWKEISLLEFTKEYEDPKSKEFFHKINIDLQKIIIQDKNGKKDHDLPEAIKPIMEFYFREQDVSEPNELYLHSEGSRIYGFYLLNMHTADIDFNLSDKEEENRLMVRYNENTSAGWEERMDYISQIFQHIGYETKQRAGYLHMKHDKPGSKEEAINKIRETTRALVSTTHLNLTFEYAPEFVDEAVKAFKDGVTDIYHYLEEMDIVKAKRDEYRSQIMNNKNNDLRF